MPSASYPKTASGWIPATISSSSENPFERLFLQSRYRWAVPLGAGTRRVYQRTGFCFCATKTSGEGRPFARSCTRTSLLSLERAQQQSSSYSINVAASNVVLQRQIYGQCSWSWRRECVWSCVWPSTTVLLKLFWFCSPLASISRFHSPLSHDMIKLSRLYITAQNDLGCFDFC